MKLQDWEMALSVLEDLETRQNTPHIMIGISFAKVAVKRQIPAKPVKKNPICYSKSIDGEELYAYDYHCPQCDAKVNSEKHHCPCGQALNWSV